MLEQEFQYFLTNQSVLFQKYPGKFVVIRGENIEGVYDTEMDAFIDASKKFAGGTFLIQQCLSGPDSYTQTFHSRAIFV